jgi:hypothetical protein
VLPITQTHNHFFYVYWAEPFVVGDCGIYALVRLLRHYCKLYELGILTDVPEPTKDSNFWKKYSIQELRDKIADRLDANGNKERAEDVRVPQAWLSAKEVRILAASLHIP